MNQYLPLLITLAALACVGGAFLVLYLVRTLLHVRALRATLQTEATCLQNVHQDIQVLLQRTNALYDRHEAMAERVEPQASDRDETGLCEAARRVVHCWESGASDYLQCNMDAAVRDLEEVLLPLEGTCAPTRAGASQNENRCLAR